MRRFWTMLAHYHAQTWNGAELARALGVSETTVRRYLDALTDALVVRQVRPWFANIAKRQVRSPKVYVRDTGLLHRLLGITDHDDLLSHPKVGASWEGLIIERIGVEIKRTDQPRLTPSIRHALADLELDRVILVHAGQHAFPLAPRVDARPAHQILSGTTLPPANPPGDTIPR